MTLFHGMSGSQSQQHFTYIYLFIYEWFNDATHIFEFCTRSADVYNIILFREWKEKGLNINLSTHSPGCGSKSQNERVHIRQSAGIFCFWIMGNCNGTLDATQIVVCYKTGAKSYKYLFLNLSLIKWKQFPKAKVYIWTFFYANICWYGIKQNQYCLVKLIIVQTTYEVDNFKHIHLFVLIYGVTAHSYCFRFLLFIT